MKVKLPIYKNKDGSDDPKFDLFDLNSRSIYPNESGDTPDLLVQKGSNVCCVVTCGGIWFASGKFGVTWKLNQAMVKPPDTFEKGKCYIPMSAEKKSDAYDSDGESVTVVTSHSEPVTESLTTEHEPASASLSESFHETIEHVPPVEVQKEEDAKPAKKETKKSTKKA
jgi:hypothetical protein